MSSKSSDKIFLGVKNYIFVLVAIKVSHRYVLDIESFAAVFMSSVSIDNHIIDQAVRVLPI